MEIELTQGKVAHINPEDWPLIADYKWYAYRSMDGRWYAHATPLDGDRAKAKVKMHNLIVGCKGVDHRDNDGLNNVRSNLRPCTDAQNQQNTGSRGGSSQYKGVSWNSRRKKWHVAFRCNGRHYFVGNFPPDQEIDAAKAYDAAILPLAGEFARLNFPNAA